MRCDRTAGRVALAASQYWPQSAALHGRESVGRRAPARLVLEIGVRQRLFVAVLHDEASTLIEPRPKLKAISAVV